MIFLTFHFYLFLVEQKPSQIEQRKNIIKSMSKVDDIKKLFSRFDFIGRVNISQYLSFCSIDSATNYKKRIKKVNSIFPWNADVIILIALLEIKDSAIQKKPFSHECFNYINKCQSIIDHTSFPKDWLLNIDELGGHAVFGPFFLQQRHYQEYIYSKLFRYYCIFNYDDTVIHQNIWPSILQII